MARSDIHARLRQSTAAVHERLHGHPGFAAVASGAISLALYRRLLERLWGFHCAFEAALDEASREYRVEIELDNRRRCGMLESDLVAVGADLGFIARLPRCGGLRRPENKGELMGALYVVEGSTLGGVHLARALKPLIGSDSADGRRFFLGYGERHGAMWRAFLRELDECARTPADQAAVIDGAMRTFLDFEDWMSGWNDSSSSATPLASAVVH